MKKLEVKGETTQSTREIINVNNNHQVSLCECVFINRAVTGEDASSAPI